MERNFLGVPCREEGVSERQGPGKAGVGGAAGLGPRRENGTVERRGWRGGVGGASGRDTRQGDEVVARRGLGEAGAGGAAGLGPHREEGVVESWGWGGDAGGASGREPAGRMGRWRDGAGRGRRGWCFGKGGRWEEGTWRGGGRETTVRVLPWKGRPPGGGGSGEVGLEGWVRMVLRGEGGRREDGTVKKRGWRGSPAGERKGRAEKRSRPGAAPSHVFFYSSFFRSSSGVSGWR